MEIRERAGKESEYRKEKVKVSKIPILLSLPGT